MHTTFRYGSEVERFLDVYLRTPNLPKHDLTRALVARGNARKAAGEILLAKAQQGMSEQVSLVTSCIIVDIIWVCGHFLPFHMSALAEAMHESNTTFVDSAFLESIDIETCSITSMCQLFWKM